MLKYLTILLILLIGLGIGLYLVRQPTLFRPKAFDSNTSGMWWGMAADNGPYIYLGGFNFQNGVYIRKVEAVDKTTNQVIWQKTYDAGGNVNNNTYGLITDQQYLYATGYKPNGSHFLAVIEKYDKLSGGLIWQHTFDDTTHDSLLYRAALYNGKVYAVGVLNTSESSGWLVAAFDQATGQRLWFKNELEPNTSDNEPNDVYVDDTGVYVDGFSASSDPSSTGARVRHYDFNGNLINEYKSNNTIGGIGGIAGDANYIYIADVSGNRSRLDRLNKQTLQPDQSAIASTNGNYQMSWQLQKVGNAIYLGGFSIYPVSGSNYASSWQINKFIVPSLASDPSFGTNGTLELYRDNTTYGQIHSLTADSSGNVFAAGCIKSTSPNPLGFGGCTLTANSGEQPAWQNISSPIHTVIPTTYCPVLGDVTGAADGGCDGQVTLVDFNWWLDEYMGRRTTKRANFNPSQDDKVSLVDFNIWLTEYKKKF